ncbi:MAG: two-component system response regulator [Nitrospinae bacterium CG11_big_fil_rev_8_21_14_0_20_56_8]|nr:MAG: two-component system response regulator [Nitrospinae bacterium CG11_big_fil_rev_8_21_14_0_20_56_8]
MSVSRKPFPILLVEDDEIDVMNVERAFSTNSLHNPLVVKSNGEDALAYLKTPDMNEESRPNLILLDINMPIMNGLEFLKACRADEELKKLPVVVLTSSREDSDRRDFFNLNVAGYILKPVDFNQFRETIQVINQYWSLNEFP